MSPEHKQNIFRQESLERLSSPERLDQLMQVIAPQDWLSLAMLGSLISLAIGWSLFGRIPVTVTGRGVFLQPYQASELQMPVAGQLKELKIRVGDRIRQGEVLGSIDRADLRKQLQQQRLKLQTLEQQNRQINTLTNQRINVDLQVLKQKRQTLQQTLQDKRTFSSALRAGDLLTLMKQRQALEQTLQDRRALAPRLKEQLENRKKLQIEGAISSDRVLEAIQVYQDNLQQITRLEAQLQELNRQEVAIEQTYRETLRQISDLRTQVRDLNSQEKKLTQQLLESNIHRKNQIQDVQQTIARLTLQLRENSQIVSQYNGRVLELSAKSGSVLSQGSRLGLIEAEGASRQLSSLVYFAIKDGKQLQPGMTLHITPDTVQRERFGGIIGTVKAVSAFPISQPTIVSAVGNAEVARSLMTQGGQIEVLAELERDPTTVTGYRWSSSKGPDVLISSGTTASVRVTVEQRAPITFVLPILRSVSGIN